MTVAGHDTRGMGKCHDGARIRLAMQRSGQLWDASFELLSKCGLHIARSRTDLFCRVQELPIDLLLVRDDDIPGFVEAKVCDLGIVGENVLQEQKLAAKRPMHTDPVLPLGYARCKLVLAAKFRIGFLAPNSVDSGRAPFAKSHDGPFQVGNLTLSSPNGRLSIPFDLTAANAHPGF
jgi:hypothetical protein